MDSITQAALGAGIGETVLGKRIGYKGAILGAIVATIPDLDVGLYLFYDKFEMLSIHRGYSHSILFSILGAFIIAYFLQRISWTKQIGYQRLWIFTWLALFTHMLLDTFTAYATQLFLPFSDARIGFDSINIVDPVYTIPLIIGLLLSLFIYRKESSRATYNIIGLVTSSIYLLCTLGIKNEVNNYFDSKLENQNIEYNSLLTIPVGIASENWYGVAKGEDSLYIQKYSLFAKGPSHFESFPINEFLLNDLDPLMAKKMRWFAKGFYTVSMEGENIRIYNLQLDMRGIVKEGDSSAPTVGYFEFVPTEGGRYSFTSGAHNDH